MTGAAFRPAVAGFGQIAVRADAGLGVDAPEQAIVARWHARIGFRENELAFPAKRGAEVGVIDAEAIRSLNHAAPPDAAFKMARLTATRATCTL